MADVDKLVDLIISKHPEISRDIILKRLEDERRKSGGLISDQVLLRMVAAEFGVEVSNAAFVPLPALGSLVPGLNDVSVIGRVIAVYPAKVSKRNGLSKFASMLVADKSGVMRVVLWDDKAELLESRGISVGHVVKLSHGYTKEGRFGHVELHLGESGDVEILEEVKTESYPRILELSTKIRAITSVFKNRRINLVGRVKEILRESTFEREDSTTGKVLRLVLADETGEIPVVIWNEKVDEVKGILQKENAMLQVVNAKVKRTLDGKLEIHADRETYIDVFEAEKEFWKIAELKDGMKDIHVQGEVATKPITREVKTAKGEAVKLTVFEIKDETGRIWVSAWRKNAEKTANLKIGEKIAIKNAYVKRGFGDQLEISTMNKTSIEIISKGK
jgi:replication factor A1